MNKRMFKSQFTNNNYFDKNIETNLPDRKMPYLYKCINISIYIYICIC